MRNSILRQTAVRGSEFNRGRQNIRLEIMLGKDASGGLPKGDELVGKYGKYRKYRK